MLLQYSTEYCAVEEHSILEQKLNKFHFCSISYVSFQGVKHSVHLLVFVERCRSADCERDSSGPAKGGPGACAWRCRPAAEGYELAPQPRARGYIRSAQFLAAGALQVCHSRNSIPFVVFFLIYMYIL